MRASNGAWPYQPTFETGVSIWAEGVTWWTSAIVTPWGVDTGVATLGFWTGRAAGVTAGHGGASVGHVTLVEIYEMK